MASAHGNHHPQFILTPQQQNLLFRALTSNQPAGGGVDNDGSLSPTAVTNSPAAKSQKGDSADPPHGLQESPYLDYDYDFGPDSSFDFDFSSDGQAKMIGDLPSTSGPRSDSKASTPEDDSPDKRSHPDDDDDELEEGGGKRRESEGKVSKKPGRKPLTNEPTSKRKAQNRAAQRAFRERKEKHLKDLETKVEELEKVSEAANSENSQLKAQIDRLTVELNEYKKRVSGITTGGSRSIAETSRQGQVFGSAAIQNLGDVNFQFEFPKFGVLPGPSSTNGNNANNANGTSPYPSPTSTTNANTQNSPLGKPNDKASPRSSSNGREGSDAAGKDPFSKFAGLFSNSSPYENLQMSNASRTSLDSAAFSLGGANSASPSASSNSNGGPSSSCGTSPEPTTQSPLGFKPLDTLTTIGEEQPNSTSALGFNDLANVDFSNLDWLTQQNGGQFDPQLFGGYREPQESVLANTSFDDSFFNDAFDVDFTTPFNMAPSPNLTKKNLIAEIDARKETDETPGSSGNVSLLNCNNIWEKLQSCPRVASGDLDLDGLCSDLQKKAKCGGSGAVVEEKDFRTIMTKYLGADPKCPTESQ